MRYFTILAILFYSCSQQTQDTVSPLTLNLSKIKLDNNQVLSSIKKYIASSSDIPSIYAITIEREDLNTISYKLSTIATYDQVSSNYPSGYFVLDNNIVLVYTGLEKIMLFDDRFQIDLKSAIGNRIPVDNMMIFCPPTRHYILKGDSLVDMGTVFDPLGPPLVESIKFLPPKAN